ncbi:MAG: ATP-binding protein [Candidatus Hodarchaeota archaeon]
MIDETAFNFSIAIYSTASTLVFSSIAIKTRRLLSWSIVLGLFALGSIFIYLQVFNESYRLIGNILYALSAITLLVIIFYEYYNFSLKKAPKIRYQIISFFIIIDLIFIVLPFGSFLVRIQLAMLLLLLLSIVLFSAVYSIKGTPSYLLMLLTLISATFTLIMTLVSSIEASTFWELSYLGNIVFITFVLAIPFVRYFEDRFILSQERYQQLYKITRVGLVTSFSDGSILAANPAAASILGYEHPEELKKLNAKTLYVNPEERNFLLKKLKREGYIDNNELKLIRKDGTHVYILASASLLTTDHNDAQTIEWVFRDISNIREAEIARKELETRRKRFIETTSHELRTPLTNIKGFVEILEKQGKDIPDDRREKSFQYIHRNISRLNRLVTDVADLSKIEKNSFQIDKQPIKICEFLNELIISYKTLLGEKLEFNPCFKPDLVLSVDPDRIQQVIDNVINNSIKNSLKDDLRIIVNVKSSPNWIDITISDHGTGIDPANLEHIFKPFVSYETEYSARGAGIGLYLCRTIVEQHGGSIRAHSEGLGHGTTIIIKLPC